MVVAAAERPVAEAQFAAETTVGEVNQDVVPVLVEESLAT